MVSGDTVSTHLHIDNKRLHTININVYKRVDAMPILENRYLHRNIRKINHLYINRHNRCEQSLLMLFQYIDMYENGSVATGNR